MEIPLPKRAIAIISLAVCLLGVFAAPARAAKHAEVSAELNTNNLQPGQQAEVAVVADIKAGFHAQSHKPLDKNFREFTVKIESPAGATAYDAIYPEGEIHDYPALGKFSVYTGRVIVYVPVQVKADAAPGPMTLKGTVNLQACDEHVCYQPEKIEFTIDTTIVARGQPQAPNKPELFKGFDPTIFSHLTSGAATSAAATGTELSLFGWKITLGGKSYLPAFIVAFFVGIIFNLMPCVLPVVPLKAYGFYEVSQHNRAKCLALGLVFSAGVVACFGVLALLVIVFKTLAWGSQFSNPWFVGVIVTILVLMAAGMFGAFEVLLPTSVYNITPSHETYTGNFLFGILTAVLSTPCTAPMFVGLLAWAGGQPTIVGVLIVLTVGAGMASPYLLLSAFPGLAKKFPRSGPWSVLIKQMMGFLLLAVAVYFAGGKFIEGRSFFWLVFAVIAAAGIFLVIRTRQLTKSATGLGVAVILAVIMIGAGLWTTLDLTKNLIVWKPYSPEAFAKARLSGKPVMVEFTANWCGNCLALEATVFRDPRVADAITKNDVVPLRADMTNENEPAKKLLTELNATGGIPLTAVYTPGEQKPAQLSSVYSTENLLTALGHASAKAVTQGK